MRSSVFARDSTLMNGIVGMNAGVRDEMSRINCEGFVTRTTLMHERIITVYVCKEPNVRMRSEASIPVRAKASARMVRLVDKVAVVNRTLFFSLC